MTALKTFLKIYIYIFFFTHKKRVTQLSGNAWQKCGSLNAHCHLDMHHLWFRNDFDFTLNFEIKVYKVGIKSPSISKSPLFDSNQFETCSYHLVTHNFLLLFFFNKNKWLIRRWHMSLSGLHYIYLLSFRF